MPYLPSLTILALSLASPQDEPQGSAGKNPQLDARESFLVSQIDAQRAGKHLRELTQEPHIAGSEADYRSALYVQGVLEEAGFEVELSEYHVLLSLPESISLAMTAPEKRSLNLSEQPSSLDEDSSDAGASPGFNAYSASAEVESEVVYAHYGQPEDFDWLASQGVDVAGKICLIRYGKIFRGLKVHNAEARGAAGVLLYSDPDDDGYRKGSTWPEGPWRPRSGLQRGSILYLSHLAGDPLTPGRPAHVDAERMQREDCSWLPQIPCIPISWGTAEPILAGMRGKNVPQNWQGGCPTTYFTGPGPSRVKMAVKMQEEIKPIWNVIGRLRSESSSERFVMVGNHRDAWVHGAIDPNSGSAVSLEAMRALGALVKSGWQPPYEIRYGSWDGEEFGLIGSTEWCEDHASEIQANCLAYFNCDAAVSGDRFAASATPDLVRMLAEAAARTEAHDGKGRLLTRWAHGGSRPPVGNLGSGSDYTAFLCHLGVPCLDFGSRGGHGVYHSLFDSAYTMEQYIDPGYRVHASMARFLAILTYRFANSEELPLDIAAWGPWLHSALESLRDLQDRDRELLLAGIAAFAAASEKGPSAAQALSLHAAFLHPEGIASRPWFRNLLVAPGLDLGYGAVTLPGLREAIESEDLRAIEHERDRLLAALARATELLR